MNELDKIFEEAGTIQRDDESIFATIETVDATGVTLLFDGSTQPGTKKYAVNSGALLKAGDRVRIKRDSGSCVVEFVIGDPMDRYPIPSGGSDGDVLMKDGADDYAVKWGSSGGPEIPSGGSTGNLLAKAANGLEWVSAPPVEGNSTKIGFMGRAAVTKKTVSKCSTSGTTSNAITTLNNLIQALYDYGLISI